jgi:hypothetical protein
MPPQISSIRRGAIIYASPQIDKRKGVGGHGYLVWNMAELALLTAGWL